MQIIAKCPICKSSWMLDEKQQDKRIRCQKCGQIYRVPNFKEVPKAVDIIKKSKSSIYVDESGKTFG